MGDVRFLAPENFKDIDLLIGGSPCQDLSFCGRRKGLSTKEDVEILSLDHYLELKKADMVFCGQSYLFWEYVRLLRGLRPKYFLLENVVMPQKWKNIFDDIMGVKAIEINNNTVSA